MRRHPVEEAHGLGDLVVVPARAVLVGEQHELASRADPGVASGVLEEQQGEQRQEHRLAGAQREGHPHEPDGLARQVGAQEVGARAGGVAGRENAR